MPVKVWVDRQTLARNRVSARHDPPIVLERSPGRQTKHRCIIFKSGGRMVYDASCSSCASVYLELEDDSGLTAD